MTLEQVLEILLVVALIATLGTLITGLFNMFGKGKEAGERSNKMMRLRILFQGFAIFIFSLLFFLKAK